MRVALITNLIHDQLGLFYISAILKKAGHDVRYFFDNRKLEREIKKFSPQLVGFSALTGNHLWAQECALSVKRILPDVKIILGGAHATYYPEIINSSGFDFICRGEGERTILALCDALQKGDDYYNIKGLWVKDGDKIYKNEFAPLEEDLDAIPFPDRSIYKLYPFYSFYHFYPFLLSSRGCPFKCAFCFEPVLRELTRGKGKYIRFRSPENVIQEAIEIKKTYKIKSYEFVDDIFGMSINWLRRFVTLWKEEIGLPFHCNLRPDMVNEDVVELLKTAGCSSVAIGLESGNLRVRNQILDKELSDDSITKAAELLHKYKIKVITYNIIGTPGETLEEAWETVRLNQRIKADYASVSLMQPYPYTGIYKFAIERGFIDDRNKIHINHFPLSFHDFLPLNTPDKGEFINLQKLFNLSLRAPWLTPFIRHLIKFSVNPIYYLIFVSLHAYGLWFRIKKVPTLFIFNLLLNVGKAFRKKKIIIKQQNP